MEDRETQKKDVGEWLRRAPAKPSWNVDYPNLDREYVDTYPVNFEKIHPKNVVARPEYAIYVHIPLQREQGSSDDNDQTRVSAGRVPEFVDALRAEMKFYAGNTDLPSRTVSSIYFGTGVSKTLDIDQFVSLLDHVVSCFDVDVTTTEITYECDPPYFERAEIDEIVSRGVNRINLHINTFDDELLSNFGAAQSREANVDAVRGAHSAGFEKVSIDLFYRLPDQELIEWKNDIETALDLDVDGFSLYSFRNSTPLIEDEAGESDGPTDIDMYYAGVDMLRAEGYNHFTEPDLAKPGKENQYLLDSWAAPQKHLIGFGPGAYSKQVNDAAYVNTYHVGEYTDLLHNDKLPVLIGQKLNAKEKMAMYMVFGAGALSIPKAPFEEAFGFRIADVFGDELDRLTGYGLLEETDNTYEVTREGKIYIDNICKAFYTEECEGLAQPRGPSLHDYTRDEFVAFDEITS